MPGLPIWILTKEPELLFSQLRFFFCRLGDRIGIGEG